MTVVAKPKHKRRIPKQSERNNFSEKVRKEIDARSNGICEYCHCKRATQRHHVFQNPEGGGVYTPTQYTYVMSATSYHTMTRK